MKLDIHTVRNYDHKFISVQLDYRILKSLQISTDLITIFEKEKFQNNQ